MSAFTPEGAWALQVNEKEGGLARHRYLRLVGNSLIVYKQAKDKHAPRASQHASVALQSDTKVTDVYSENHDVLPAGVSHIRASLTKSKDANVSLVRSPQTTARLTVSPDLVITLS